MKVETFPLALALTLAGSVSVARADDTATPPPPSTRHGALMPVPPATRPQSPVAMGFGIGFISLGATALTLAAVTLALPTCATTSDPLGLCVPGSEPAAFAAVGAFFALVGVMLTVEGHRPVPAHEPHVAPALSWRVSLAPMNRGATLAVQF